MFAESVRVSKRLWVASAKVPSSSHASPSLWTRSGSYASTSLWPPGLVPRPLFASLDRSLVHANFASSPSSILHSPPHSIRPNGLVRSNTLQSQASQIVSRLTIPPLFAGPHGAECPPHAGERFLDLSMSASAIVGRTDHHNSLVVTWPSRDLEGQEDTAAT